MYTYNSFMYIQLLLVIWFRIASSNIVGGNNGNKSFKEFFDFELMDMSNDEALEFYNEQNIKESISITAALLRRIEYNTSRMIVTTEFLWLYMNILCCFVNCILYTASLHHVE